MKEITISELSRKISESERDVLIVCAPNYEARSLSLLLSLAESFSRLPNCISVVMITLQGGATRVEPLEHLKRRNIEAAEQLLRSRGARVYPCILPYPDQYSSERLSSTMQEILSQINDSFDVVLDLTSLPGRVIFDLMYVLDEASSLDRLSAFYLAYATPESYPKTRYPTESGEPVLLRRQQRISVAMSPLRRASAAIVLGVQGFQAEQFEAALPPDRRVSAYAFINQRNILYSLEVFRLNTSVFYRDSVDPHIYLNFPMGHEQLMHWADEVELASGGAYLIAPFGPKPMVVSAWASLNRLRYRMRSATSPVNALTDVVLPGSHHYGSPYSLGRGSVCVFSMQLGKVGRGG